MELKDAVACRVKSHLAALEGLAHEVLQTFVKKVAVLVDSTLQVRLGIPDSVVFAKAPARAAVIVSRHSHRKRLVGTKFVIFLFPTLQPPLLSGHIDGGRLDRLRFKVLVHPLMGSIVLRTSRPRELDGYSLLYPPYA